MAGHRSYSSADLAELASGLRRLLAVIEAGELTADSGLVARLEGAVAVLETLTGDGEII